MWEQLAASSIHRGISRDLARCVGSSEPPAAHARGGFRRSKPCGRTKDANGNELSGNQCYGYCVDELYHQWRTHLSLGKDTPQPRRRQQSTEGPVIEIPEVGGLHHHYERRAA